MRLILICGAQRSGTTLMQTLLANAVDSPILPEAHILSDILAAYRRAKEFGNKTRVIYPADNDLLSFFRAFAERHVADIAAAGERPGALVLKDPNFIQTFPEAAAIFPHAVRIVCIRDPRDIAASFVQIGQRQSATKPGKYERRDILFISKKILASYQPLLQAVPAGVAMVRYEELASNPRACLEALGRDTGLDLSLDRIEDAAWLDAPVRHAIVETERLQEDRDIDVVGTLAVEHDGDGFDRTSVARAAALDASDHATRNTLAVRDCRLCRRRSVGISRWSAG